MKYALLLSLLLLPAAAQGADAPAPDKPICLRANHPDDYNARPIAQHDVFAQNSVGDRRGVRISTTCIHIWPESFVALHSSFTCVGMGDQVSARTIDGHGETCRVTKVTPFVEGSIAPPYK